MRFDFWALHAWAFDARHSWLRVYLMKLVYYLGTPFEQALREVCYPIEKFDDALHRRLDKMREIMEEHKGVGIAANQTNYLYRCFLARDNTGQIVEFCNPVITPSQEEIVMNEGCLSAPGIFLSIKRPASVTAVFQDRLGNRQSLVATGLFARCILHEYDHLEGTFFLDIVNRETRRVAISKLRRIRG